VLEPFLYEDQDHLLAVIADKVIAPAETKATRVLIFDNDIDVGGRRPITL
jgi:hypothetical protein